MSGCASRSTRTGCTSSTAKPKRRSDPRRRSKPVELLFRRLAAFQKTVIDDCLLSHARPVRLAALDVLLQLRAPPVQPIFVLSEIQLAIDDGPSCRIDEVFMRGLPGHAHRTIAVVLRGIAIRIG